MEKDLDESTTPNTQSEMSEIPNSQPASKPQIKFSIAEKWKEIMNSIKAKTGIDGIYVIIFLSLCVLLVYFGIFESLITSLVGTLYPGFSTIKAIQKNKDKKEWLTYWVIFGSFLIFDMFSGIIIKFVPYYFVLKILFLIWMFIPGSNGCRIVYDFLISKVMKPIEQIIDIFFEEYKEVQGEIVQGAKKRGVKIMKNIKNLTEKMQIKKIDESTTIKSKLVDSVNPNSISWLPPQVDGDSLMKSVRKEGEKEEDKEKQKHINFNNDIEEFTKIFNQKSVESVNNENEDGNISPVEDIIDDNKK